MGVKGVTGCMPDDYSVSPIMGCHLLSSIHKSNLRVCVGEREMGERDSLLHFLGVWGRGQFLGGRWDGKIQPTSHKSRMWVDGSASHVKNTHGA